MGIPSDALLIVAFNIPDCPVFCPSEEDFGDPLRYIGSIGAGSEGCKSGVVRVVPPAAFRANVKCDGGNCKIYPRLQVLSELSIKNRSLLYNRQIKTASDTLKKARRSKNVRLTNR